MLLLYPSLCFVKGMSQFSQLPSHVLPEAASKLHVVTRDASDHRFICLEHQWFTAASWIPLVTVVFIALISEGYVTMLLQLEIFYFLRT